MRDIETSRRDFLGKNGVTGLTLVGLTGCEKRQPQTPGASASAHADYSHEEYVWLSAHTNLPLFMAHDHPALKLIGRELGVRVTITGPNTLDIGALVAAIEQTVARQPAGIMVVGWDPSALVSPINRAVDKGIPVVCVDADVRESKRLAFIGTDWYDLGVRQGQAMLQVLKGQKGKIALLGLRTPVVSKSLCIQHR